ncbi:MAG: hypothetical protein Q9203_003082 [Teloschistes exilis]
MGSWDKQVCVRLFQDSAFEQVNVARETFRSGTSSNGLNLKLLNLVSEQAIIGISRSDESILLTQKPRDKVFGNPTVFIGSRNRVINTQMQRAVSIENGEPQPSVKD